ncbi:MAG: HEAT repeat domain-containing protein [Bacteroidales bacterium]
MKKLIIIIGGFVAFLVLGVLALYFWTDIVVKQNIALAQQKYPGKAENALIAYLLDSTNSPYNRTHIAVWTLGQINSEKAIPVLKMFYYGDPDGKNLSGNQKVILDQNEIYKALNAKKVNWLPLHARLKR